MICSGIPPAISRTKIWRFVSTRAVNATDRPSGEIAGNSSRPAASVMRWMRNSAGSASRPVRDPTTAPIPAAAASDSTASAARTLSQTLRTGMADGGNIPDVGVSSANAESRALWKSCNRLLRGSGGRCSQAEGTAFQFESLQLVRAGWRSRVGAVVLRRGSLSRQHLVEHHAQAENVGATGRQACRACSGDM